MRLPAPSGLHCVLVVVVAGLWACTAGPDTRDEQGTRSDAAEITREQAIEIARPHVSFEPQSVEAVADQEEGRPVWRVTFRGRPPGPDHAIGEFQEIVVDRRTGEIVALAMS